MKNLIKPIMVIIGATQVLTWGLPGLISLPLVGEVFGQEQAGYDSHWARYTGILNIVWGGMLIAAAAHPRKNRIVIIFSIVLFIATFLITILMIFWFGQLDLYQRSWWLPVVSSAAFTILLIAFYPKDE